MTTVDAAGAVSRPRKTLNIGLWVAQAVLAALYIAIAVVKLGTPTDQLARMMPWTGEYPTLRYIAGWVDLAGGVGVLLPALLRIFPGLTVLAALGCTVLQVLAIGFHLSRGEAAALPVNAILIALSLFVLWGRGRKVPIAPRG